MIKGIPRFLAGFTPKKENIKDTNRRKRTAMPVVEGGVLKSRRSLWRLSTFSHYFWVVAYFIRAFFWTLFSMERSDAYKANGFKKWDGGPGGGGSGGQGRGPYGGGPRPRGPRGMSDLQSDHDASPACGSCCG